MCIDLDHQYTENTSFHPNPTLEIVLIGKELEPCTETVAFHLPCIESMFYIYLMIR